ncbi:NlpC/P60 family protein [Streptomyces sp. NPDC047108]|uniref:C40 family peptidase n=1 Tax=Streptomyces sp. NPDC047108 TaxID=3155025 RepID=UPI0033CBBCC8
MSRRFVGSVRTAAVAAGTALAVAVPPAPAVVADPADRSVRDLLTQLQSLYQRAEEAGEAYKSADEDLRRQHQQVRRLGTQLAQARGQLAAGRNDAGRLARQQYQNSAGAVSPYLQLLMSRSLRGALDQGHMLQRAANERNHAVIRLAGTERRLDGVTTRARTALDKQQTLAKKRLTLRATAQRRLSDVERALASLSPQQLTQVGQLEQSLVATAQRAFMGSSGLKAVRGTRKPSRAGALAIAYAFSQLGKPYEWGAEGPASFDCSGLTSQAWAHAGRKIPRTSQLQWRNLPRVPVKELRPGDLVIYYEGATHVALYVGNGMVVQAPRPGGVVKVSPIAANPILGAVRPDEGSKSLQRYARPKLPKGSKSGNDTGYGSETAPA